MPLIHNELKWFVEEHNTHRIRKQKDRKTPQGIPEDLYTFPDHFGMQMSVYIHLLNILPTVHITAVTISFLCHVNTGTSY